MADTAKTNPLCILAIALAHKRAYRHLNVCLYTQYVLSISIPLKILFDKPFPHFNVAPVRVFV